MKVGVLGGTFDPVHLGHLAVAEEVKASLSLDEVIFVPAGQPWLKSGAPISPAGHRVEMVRLAITGKPYFKLSLVEVERSGPSYTVDTMAALQGRLAGSTELFFILGWDNLVQLPRWREPGRLIRSCYLVAVPRVGHKPPALKPLEEVIPGISERVILLDGPRIDISASEIRRRVSLGLPFEELVPEAVARYIKEHGLYLKEVD